MIPATLQALPQWCCWRWIDRADPRTGELRRTKVPVRAATGGPASSVAPATWAPFPVALRAAKASGVAGLGFVFARGGGLVGVDLDGCRDPHTGALSPWAATVVARLGTYWELSPSGRGLHGICRGTLPGPRRHHKAPGQSIELYPDGRFFTMTGQALAGASADVRNCGAALCDLYHELFPAVPAPVVPLAPAPDLSDAAILRIASGARNGAKFRSLWRGEWEGYSSQSEADCALCAILAFYARDEAQIERLFAWSGLADAKWFSRPAYRAHTIARACAGQRARFGSRAA